MDRFVFPKSFYESIKTFKPANRETLYTGIFEYVFEDKEPTFNKDDVKRVWILIYPILKKAKNISNTKSAQSKDNIATMSRQSNENVKTISVQCSFKEKEKEKDINITPKSPKGADDGFDKFWEVYPNKKSKATARKAFKKVKVSLDVLISAVKKQSTWEQWQKDNGAFIPYAATWLNQCRWEDEEKVITNPEPEVKKKDTPKVTQCPECGSYDLRITLDRVMCKSCGAFYDYDHSKGKWVRA